MGAMDGLAFLTVTLFEGSVNANVFYAWMTQELLPLLIAGAVIVWTASFYTRADILESIAQTSCTLEFLLLSSSDLNPIVFEWAQTKVIRR